MPKGSIADQAHQRLAEADPESGDRFVDLQLDLVNTVGEVVQRFGGRWDRRAVIENDAGEMVRAGDFVGDAKRSRILEIHPGQEEAMDWFIDWLAKWYDNIKPRDYSAMFAGGRRGGKSWLACAVAIGFAVAVPGSIVWIVSPTEGHYGEVMKYLTEMMPKDWYVDLGHPFWQYTLANGSVIIMRSAQTSLKKGEADFIVLNEAQQMKKIRFTQTRAAIVDKGGLLLCACNPPDDGDPGDWVGDFAVEAKARTRAAKYLFFDPLLNPHIDQDALQEIAKEVGPREFNIQIRGMFLSPSDAVFYNWDRPFNELGTPEIGDCTRQFTELKEREAYDQIVTLDVGRFPKMVGIVWRLFRNPVYRSMEKALAWVVDEIVIDGDEAAICYEAEARGYGPDETIVVLDASGWWQTQQTAGMKPKRTWHDVVKGRGSVDIMRGAGWHNVVRPDRRYRANPDNIERARAVCARIGNAIGYRDHKVEPERFLFVDPSCKTVCKSMRSWRYKHGRPSRTSEHAHAGDGVGYFVWRYWPRRRVIDKSDPIAILSKKPNTKGVTDVY